MSLANIPAFPRPATVTPNNRVESTAHEGMSLRDWFAGMALGGMVQHTMATETRSCDEIGLIPIYSDGEADIANKLLATWSYALADAMLKARQEGPQPS